uniref:Uncharacterized protein n=1 Tax=mine drainage metagenome TaxID=410659 RepID=E6QLN3_9ZZZZ
MPLTAQSRSPPRRWISLPHIIHPWPTGRTISPNRILNWIANWNRNSHPQRVSSASMSGTNVLASRSPIRLASPRNPCSPSTANRIPATTCGRLLALLAGSAASVWSSACPCIYPARSALRLPKFNASPNSLPPSLVFPSRCGTSGSPRARRTKSSTPQARTESSTRRLSIRLPPRSSFSRSSMPTPRNPPLHRPRRPIPTHPLDQFRDSFPTQTSNRPNPSSYNQAFGAFAIFTDGRVLFYAPLRLRLSHWHLARPIRPPRMIPTT